MYGKDYIGLLIATFFICQNLSAQNNSQPQTNDNSALKGAFINKPPVAVNDTFVFFNGCLEEITGNVMLNDYDPNRDPLKIYFALTPKLGYLIMKNDGSFIIDLPEDYSGIIEFEYFITELRRDRFKANAMAYIIVHSDCDCDSIADKFDIDNDNDGIIDIDEGNGRFDSDNDGMPDNLDIDSDNDGITDNIEWQSERNYIPPLNKDLNCNGWDDAYDVEAGGTYYLPEDTNSDGIPDFLDADSDSDGISDYIEATDLNNDGVPDTRFSNYDSDQDGLDDSFDNKVCGMKNNNSIGQNTPLPDFNKNGVRDWRDFSNNFDETESFIFPNPIVKEFKIYYPSIHQDHSIKIEIVSTNGAIIKTYNIANITSSVQVSDIKPGFYFAILTTDTFRKTQHIYIKSSFESDRSR